MNENVTMMSEKFRILCAVLLVVGGAVAMVHPAAGIKNSLPDLVVNGVIAPSTAVPGGEVTLSATVKNAGSGSSSPSYTYFYLSKDMVFDSSDLYLGQKHISSLPPGRSWMVSYSATIPSGSSGNYYILAKADGSNRISEMNEVNNDAPSTLMTVQSGSIPAPTPTPTPTPSITVTAPNGGQTWQRGTTQTVSWDYTGNPGSAVKIVLVKGSTDVGIIKDSWATGSNGKGSFTWPISSTGMTGSDFRVSVQGISQSTINDMSNNYFTITPASSPTPTPTPTPIPTAATYYVSTSGSDSNPGTSAAPWAHCPSMVGWTGSATLNPGDTVYFKNTDTWTATIPAYEQWLWIEPGVTYDGRTWGTAGSKATITITSSGTKSVSFVSYEDDVTYPTVIDGFKFNPIGNNTAIAFDYPHGGYMTNMTGAAKIVRNCEIDGSGQKYDETYGITAQPYGGRRVDNLQILNNTVHNCYRDGIYVYPGNEYLPLDNKLVNVTIRYNEAYLNGISSTSSGAGIKLKNHVMRALIENNYVHDNYGSGIDLSSSSPVMYGPDDCIIRYNLVMNNKNAGSTKWNTALSIYSSNSSGMSTSAQIYGNILWNPELIGGIYEPSYVTDNKVNLTVNNNIIYSGGPAVYTESKSSNIKLSNNILISNIPEGQAWPASDSPVLYDPYNVVKDHTSNIYWRTDGGSNLISVNRGQTVYNAGNLATWEPSGFSTNPNFKNAGNLPTGFLPNNMPNTDGLSIVSGNAIGHGTNLGYPYDYSINNVVRGTTWDIGPYQTF